MCYGRNLASGRLVELGEATGVIAAQSIGEPGTQLTMRTFHIGGTASRVSEQSRLDAKNNGTVRFIGLQTVKSKSGDLVVMNRQGSIALVDEKNRERERYSVVYGAKLKVNEGDPVTMGQVMVEWDPYTFAILTEIGGTVKFGEVSKGQRKIYVVADNGTEKEYSVPKGVHINVQEGERVKAGEPLMDGPLNPHDILAVLGEKELQSYLVNEIQEVYRLQGVNISDKHIEVIVRQMMRWRKVEDVGDTTFLLEQQVDKFRFAEENDRVIKLGGRPATGRPLLLGITKASLSTESFISAASFQETTRVLTEASIQGAVDHLRGLKENVIVGRLIPAGTGMEYYRNIRLAPELEEAAAKVQEEVSQAYQEAERALELMRQEGETEELAAE